MKKEIERINEDLDVNLHANRHLGMSFIYEDSKLGESVRLFFSLSKLKYILSTVSYEKLYFENNWLKGFLHFRGENFSVIDIKTLFNSNEFTVGDINTNLILLKEEDSMRVGVLGRNLSLIDLDEQYFGMRVEQVEPEAQFYVDDKLYDIFRKINLENLSYISAEIIEKEKQPNYLNLAHVQKYKKVYNKYFKEIEKIRLYKDYTKKVEDFNIFYFGASFFIDDSGILGIEIDIDKLNKYLYQAN